MIRFATLFFASLSIACSANAGVSVDSHEVTYRDLDLSSPGGAAALHRRVARAIDAICADPYGPSPGVVIDQRCKAEAWAGVRPQLETTIAAAQRDGSELVLLIPHPTER
jgi:UrcA family protein